MKASIISKPQNNLDTHDNVPEYHFEYFETTGRRKTQEDALAWHVLPDGALQNLTPQEIGFRLWTSYRLLDQAMIERERLGGTTASTTIFDGRGNLITATLADAVAFAAIYDKQGMVRNVIRLNQVTHSAHDETEVQRITGAGGTVFGGRVFGSLAVSRAIGDYHYKPCVSSDARIDITNCQTLIQSSELNPDDAGEIRIITSCDGFTEKATNQTKAGHEQYLLAKLRAYEASDKIMGLAAYLAKQAIADGSLDNVSVSVQTLPGTNNEPFALLQGIYDGHGGSKVAHYVADNVGQTFLAQCQLTAEQYANQDFSVMKYRDIYQRDHANESIPPSAFNTDTLSEQLKNAVSVAQEHYAAYHRLTRNEKANSPLNRGAGDGMFSFFRHLSSGQNMAARWVETISNKTSDDACLTVLMQLLQHPKTRYHRHSFGSFVLDELSKIPALEGVQIKPGARGIYEHVPEIIGRINQTLHSSPASSSLI